MTPARKFLTCSKCNSAVLASFIQASGLCKVCDARRLAQVVFVPTERSSDAENVPVDFGMDPEMQKDAETGEWYTVDDDGERHVIETVNTTEEDKARSRKMQRLEDATTALLEREEKRIQENLEAFSEWAAWYCSLKESTNPAQFLANKTREANYVWLRDLKDGYAAASANQCSALVRLGWDADDVRNMKLTVAEASRLLQRGPRWLY